MRFDILSLFPEYFQGPFDVSILRRAKEAGLVEIGLIDIRLFSQDKYRRVDAPPYGGGPGMVLCPDPLVRAIRSVRRDASYVIYLSPQGNRLNAAKCQELAHHEHLVLLSGHYEGIDERVMKEVDEEISIGDYVLPSGSAAAVVLVEAVSRFIPGVIGDPMGVVEDSFQQGMFEGPQYTRPEEFEGERVPDVLLSGHHAKIRTWRHEQALRKTRVVRPDLLSE